MFNIDTDKVYSKPLEVPCILDLAASASPEIATVIFRAIVYLKPQWLDYTFLFSGPRGLLDDSDSPIPSEEDNGYFDRTLVAYCAAYKVRTFCLAKVCFQLILVLV